MEKNIFDSISRISKSTFALNTVKLFNYESGEVIDAKDEDNIDYPDGTLINCKVGNAIYPMVVINKKLRLIQTDENVFSIFIEKFVYDGANPKWVKIGEGDPNDLIMNGTLKEHDIIRFVNENNDFVPCIPELELGDITGVFYVGRAVGDMESSMYDIFQQSLEKDEDDDEEELESFDYTEGDLEIIPATPIIEYLHVYGNTIRTAAKAVDMMDAEWEKLSE